MYLKNITLRNWKAYENARFDLPSPRSQKNIIVIGAQNGYGKTSLFEAVVLGLFGKDGLPLIARAPFAEVGEERLASNYRTFLERALNRNAIESGRTSCAVKMTFGLDDDEEIEILRTWNFTDNGNFKPQDEDVQIFEGAMRKPIGLKTTVAAERTEFYRDYIANTFLPYYLAAFFMFDGEQVSSFAEVEMNTQVKRGIQGLLGIPVLRELALDLRKYAKLRRSESPAGNTATMMRLEKARDTLSVQLANAQNRLEELAPQLADMSAERERLTRDLDSYGAGSQAQFEEQHSAVARHTYEVEKAQESLHKLVAEDVSLASAGKPLRAELEEQLGREQIRAGWEAGRAQGDLNLHRFIGLLSEAMTDVKPPLQNQQQDRLRQAVEGSWESLWHPPPEGCADRYIHDQLTASDRLRTIQKLQEISALGASQITTLLDTIAYHESEASKIQEQIVRLEGIAPQLDQKKDRLKSGQPPSEWSALKYGFEPTEDGRDGNEEAQAGRGRGQAAAGGRAGLAGSERG